MHSKTIMLKEKIYSKRIHSIRFHLHNILEQLKLFYPMVIGIKTELPTMVGTDGREALEISWVVEMSCLDICGYQMHVFVKMLQIISKEHCSSLNVNLFGLNLNIHIHQ